MTKIFFSYSHKDEEMRDTLEIHLSSLKRKGIISTWHDRRITAGDDFNTTISEKLEDADIILLLVSPYFIASDYCYEIEMKRAMERHYSGEATVIPIILHPCDWHDLMFGKLMACPSDGKPVSKFPNLHDAFLDITKAIKNITTQKSGGNQQESETVESITVKSSEKRSNVIRSSNLRLKKDFSDHEIDKFLVDAFEYMAKFFEGSLDELQKRNDRIEIFYRRIDANTFSAAIYKNGTEASRCTIWLRELRDFPSGIMYSQGSNNNGTSFNESLSVEGNGYKLFLKPQMRTAISATETQLSFEGAAEYYWSMLIEYLQ